MNKGEKTHQRIVRQAGEVFNQFGYGSTPVSAIMQATGMQKGGLYNHFGSKEELAIEAFRFNVSSISSFFTKAIEGKDDPVERLRLLLNASLSIAAGSVVAGGCPILNAAIESDDAIPFMREEAAEAAKRLRALIRTQIGQAQKSGRLKRDEDAETLSFFFLASLEGGIMLAKLHGTSDPLQAVVRVLNSVIDGLLISSTQ